MKKRFLSVLCGLIIVASTISINVSAVGAASQDYTVATNESVLSGSLSVEGGSCSSDDIITLSTDVQTASAGSSELSDGQSQDINVYLTTTIEDEFCDSTVNSSIIIDLKDNYVKYKSSVYDKKRRKAKIEIRSATGIYNDINVSYAWHNIKESSSNLNWTRIGFKVESVEKQKEALLNSDIIVTYSEEIITPEGGDGTYRLLIKVDNLKDIYGNSYNGVFGNIDSFIK